MCQAFLLFLNSKPISQKFKGNWKCFDPRLKTGSLQATCGPHWVFYSPDISWNPHGPHHFHLLTSSTQARMHLCVLSLWAFVPTALDWDLSSHRQETHVLDSNWFLHGQPATEVRQEFTSTDSKLADKIRRQGSIILLTKLSSTQPYRSDRSLSNPSSCKGHSFLDNSLGTICQWKHSVCKHRFQKNDTSQQKSSLK